MHLEKDFIEPNSEKTFFNSFCLHSVKFLREVTPYFRKASIISEVGWELQRAFLCPMTSTGSISCGTGISATTPRADTRYIPLQLTHLARNLKYHDNGEYLCAFSLNLYFFLILPIVVAINVSA